MKDKNMIWYLGYVISIILVLIIFLTDFSKMVDIGLALLFTAIFSVSNTQLFHNKGNVTNMVNTILLGLATVIFICLDYLIPAIITGVIIAVQPIILIIVSNMIEKKM